MHFYNTRQNTYILFFWNNSKNKRNCKYVRTAQSYYSIPWNLITLITFDYLTYHFETAYMEFG